MGMAMSDALAMLRWHGMREFRNASQNQVIFGWWRGWRFSR